MFISLLFLGCVVVSMVQFIIQNVLFRLFALSDRILSGEANLVALSLGLVLCTFSYRRLL